MSLEIHSDYGSGSSINSINSWGSQEPEVWSKPKLAAGSPPVQKTASFLDLVLGRCSLEDAMREFRLNGSDSPYNPDDDQECYRKCDPPTAPSRTIYRRQSSWPAPGLTPSMPLPQPVVQPTTTLLQPDMQHGTPLMQPTVPLLQPDVQSTPLLQPKVQPLAAATLPVGNSAGYMVQPDELPTNMLSTNVARVMPETVLSFKPIQGNVWSDAVGYEEMFQLNEPAPTFATSTPIIEEVLTPDQRRVLSSLSDDVVYSLLKQLELARGGDVFEKKKKRYSVECRFCKNNGERESYYRSHALKDGAGRVACPVLRRYRCARCLATGDHAHTAKYCPFTTADERLKSSAMMRSVRLSSGRHRRGPPTEYVVFGETPPAVMADTVTSQGVLRPEWAALEQKLMM